MLSFLAVAKGPKYSFRHLLREAGVERASLILQIYHTYARTSGRAKKQLPTTFGDEAGVPDMQNTEFCLLAHASSVWYPSRKSTNICHI
jgi:hypothetical protein